MTMPKVGSVAWAARELGYHPDTVYRLIHAGMLKCYRLGTTGRRYRVTAEHIAEYLRMAETGAKAPQDPPPAPTRPARRVLV